MMRIGIIGGTGALGRGLAARFAPRNYVVIGSRSREKGEAAAAELEANMGGEISGGTNENAASGCDLAILAIPDLRDTSLLEGLKVPLKGKIVISPIVPMTMENGLMTCAMRGRSAAEEVASVLNESKIVAAFHNLPAPTLLQITRKIEFDVLVACDRKVDYEVVANLVMSVEGLRPMYVGPIMMARLVEGITPLLLNAAKLNGQRRLSIKLVS